MQYFITALNPDRRLYFAVGLKFKLMSHVSSKSEIVILCCIVLKPYNSLMLHFHEARYFLVNYISVMCGTRISLWRYTGICLS